MNDRYVREAERRQITGVPRSSWYRLERAGLVPQRRRISPGCVGWLMSEISAWMQNRPVAEGTPTTATDKAA